MPIYDTMLKKGYSETVRTVHHFQKTDVGFNSGGGTAEHYALAFVSLGELNNSNE
jgi:hypothetical protein